MDDRSAFLARIITEDVLPCLIFENAELSTVIFDAIKQNALEMEYCNEDKPTPRYLLRFCNGRRSTISGNVRCRKWTDCARIECEFPPKAGGTTSRCSQGIG